MRIEIEHRESSVGNRGTKSRASILNLPSSIFHPRHHSPVALCPRKSGELRYNQSRLNPKRVAARSKAPAQDIVFRIRRAGCEPRFQSEARLSSLLDPSLFEQKGRVDLLNINRPVSRLGKVLITEPRATETRNDLSQLSLTIRSVVEAGNGSSDR